MLWSINRLSDRSDAFVREAGAAMGCVARNRYHRKIVETGMVGGFLVGARRINEAAGVIAEKMTEIQRVTDQFETMIGGVFGAVASAATTMQSTAEGMSAPDAETNRHSVTVATAADNASVNITPGSRAPQ